MGTRIGQRRSSTIVGSSGKIAHDNLTDYPIFMDIVHHEIHEGSVYQYTATYSLGDEGQKLFSIVTPDTTTWVHLNIPGLLTARGANANVAIYHSSVVDSIGTGVTTIANLNANYGISHVASVYEDPTTITNTGTLLHREWLASGNKTGATTSGRNEVILKQNATHLVILTSEGATNDLATILQFYDLTNI